MAQKLIAGGAWVQIAVNGSVVGLVTQASYDEDWGVQPANVLNYHGPVDYDSQGYSCNITLGTYVPERPGEGLGLMEDSLLLPSYCLHEVRFSQMMVNLVNLI